MKIGNSCSYMCYVDRDKLKITTRQIRIRGVDKMNHLWNDLYRNIWRNIKEPINYNPYIYDEDRIKS